MRPLVLLMLGLALSACSSEPGLAPCPLESGEGLLEPLPAPEGLAGLEVEARVVGTGRDDLWLLTQDGALHHFDGRRWRQVPFSLPGGVSLPAWAPPWRSSASGGRGGIWLANLVDTPAGLVLLRISAEGAREDRTAALELPPLAAETRATRSVALDARAGAAFLMVSTVTPASADWDPDLHRGTPRQVERRLFALGDDGADELPAPAEPSPWDEAPPVLIAGGPQDAWIEPDQHWDGAGWTSLGGAERVYAMTASGPRALALRESLPVVVEAGARSWTSLAGFEPSRTTLKPLVVRAVGGHVARITLVGGERRVFEDSDKGRGDVTVMDSCGAVAEVLVDGRVMRRTLVTASGDGPRVGDVAFADALDVFEDGTLLLRADDPSHRLLGWVGESSDLLAAISRGGR